MSSPLPTIEYGDDNGQEPDLKGLAEDKLNAVPAFKNELRKDIQDLLNDAEQYDKVAHQYMKWALEARKQAKELGKCI